MTVPNIVSKEQVEQSTLPDFIPSDAGSVQSLQKMFSDILVCSLFFVNTSIMMVEVGGVVVKASSVGQSESV
jgi:hypothetical protein